MLLFTLSPIIGTTAWTMCWTNAESRESELVDVYNLTGTLVRRQVKRADAVKGLKKGIYIVGGQKYVVTER